MGTNFYLEPEPVVCPTCGHDRSEELHIGKSSGGWVFAWRGYENYLDQSPAGRQLADPGDWVEFLSDVTAAGTHHISDEYGRRWSLTEFLGMVESKRLPRANGEPPSRHPLDGQCNAYHSTVGDDVLFHEFS